MMVDMALAEPIVTLAEAQAFARIETNEEEALVAGKIRSASALCEAILGHVVIAVAAAEEDRRAGERAGIVAGGPGRTEEAARESDDAAVALRELLKDGHRIGGGALMQGRELEPDALLLAETLCMLRGGSRRPARQRTLLNRGLNCGHRVRS